MTATATKPKAERTIVRTKLTASGLETTLAPWVGDQFEHALNRMGDLSRLPHCKEAAEEARDSLKKLMALAQSTPTATNGQP